MWTDLKTHIIKGEIAPQIFDFEKVHDCCVDVREICSFGSTEQ